MYVKSAADERGKQAIASRAAVARWGSGPSGCEVIAHPACKGKYQPWKGGERQVCICHIINCTHLASTDERLRGSTAVSVITPCGKRKLKNGGCAKAGFHSNSGRRRHRSVQLAACNHGHCLHHVSVSALSCLRFLNR